MQETPCQACCSTLPVSASFCFSPSALLPVVELWQLLAHIPWGAGSFLSDSNLENPGGDALLWLAQSSFCAHLCGKRDGYFLPKEGGEGCWADKNTPSSQNKDWAYIEDQVPGLITQVEGKLSYLKAIGNINSIDYNAVNLINFSLLRRFKETFVKH